MPRRLPLALAALLAAPLTAAPLSAGEFGCPYCRSDRACVLKVEPGTEEETCYDVECKEVCIPPVRFPWESCRAPRSGRARVVARLKEEKRDEPTCDYVWQVACPRCGRPIAKDEAKDKSKKPAPPAPAPSKPATKAGANQRPAKPSPAPPSAPPSGRSSTK